MFTHRLLYRSDAALVGSRDEIDDQVRAIVTTAHATNKAAEVTGALLHFGSVFIQVLEGSVEAVERTFERICCDLRHRHVRLLQLAIVEDRLFGDWSMSNVTPTAELARICPTLEAVGSLRLDAAKADEALVLMRNVLLAERRAGAISSSCNQKCSVEGSLDLGR